MSAVPPRWVTIVGVAVLSAVVIAVPLPLGRFGDFQPALAGAVLVIAARVFNLASWTMVCAFPVAVLLETYLLVGFLSETWMTPAQVIFEVGQHCFWWPLIACAVAYIATGGLRPNKALERTGRG